MPSNQLKEIDEKKAVKPIKFRLYSILDSSAN